MALLVTVLVLMARVVLVAVAQANIQAALQRQELQIPAAAVAEGVKDLVVPQAAQAS